MPFSALLFRYNKLSPYVLNMNITYRAEAREVKVTSQFG